MIGSKIRGQRANYIVVDEFACLGHNTLIETDRGIYRIGDAAKDSKDFALFTGEKNIKEKPAHFIATPLSDVYEIETQYGFKFKCSSIHQVMTINGWKLAKDLTKNDWIICDNIYEFPKEKVSLDNLEMDEDLAWLFGMLVSEGSNNSKHTISVHMTDDNCINKIKSILDHMTKNKVSIHDRKAYKDKRGWDCKTSKTVYVCDYQLREKFVKLGLDRTTVLNKKTPWSILRSPRNIIVSYLKGLFEGDGSCFNFYDKKKRKSMGIAYYSASEQLCDEVQFLLKKLDIFSTKTSRKSKISKLPQWMVRVNSSYAKKLFDLLQIDKWNGKDNECLIHEDKNGFYILKNNKPTCKNPYIVMLYKYSKAHRLKTFQQEQDAINFIANSQKIYRDAYKVRSVKLLPDKEILYDFYLPETHSFYGNGFKQHNSVNPEVFDVVVRGFAAVSSNPVDKIKERYRIKKLKKLGVWNSELENNYQKDSKRNQIVYSGTPTYHFNHFYKHFKKWESIIKSKGDPKALDELFGEDKELKEAFNWRDYAIIRIPYNYLPEGLLDSAIIAQAKANLPTSHFLMEYCSCFVSDSDGFYRRSIIENATVNKPILLNGNKIQFNIMRQGNPDMQYVIGVDPAADADNAAIVLLELHSDHRRVVHCWTTNKQKYNNLKKRMLEKNIVVGDDYYSYIAKKIRQLMSLFPVEKIVMDKHGGGTAIMEALASRANTPDGELPIYEEIVEDEEKPTDVEEGLHILRMLVPSSELNAESNHGMLKDIQEKVLLFPMFDTIELARSIELDSINSLDNDSYEDLLMEIEELKTEMTTIVVTSTPTGVERFDTPAVKSEGMKKGDLRKDRFSALLYANYYARNKNKQESIQIKYKPVGRRRDSSKTTQGNSPMYVGLGVAKFGNASWLNTRNARFSGKRN